MICLFINSSHLSLWRNVSPPRAWTFAGLVYCCVSAQNGVWYIINAQEIQKALIKQMRFWHWDHRDETQSSGSREGAEIKRGDGSSMLLAQIAVCAGGDESADKEQPVRRGRLSVDGNSRQERLSLHPEGNIKRALTAVHKFTEFRQRWGESFCIWEITRNFYSLILGYI